MNVKEAEKVVRNYYRIANPRQSDEFALIEALEFLIANDPKPQYMLNLGGHYYEKRRFDLAEKYYLMASEYGYEEAYACLGYIYYYGRTGERDYQKAFENYSKAMELGNIISTYKVADMYKNGYYVEKDYAKYCSIIKDLYERIKDDDDVFSSVPEVSLRLAEISMQEGNDEEAERLLYNARPYLESRLYYNPFFGDVSNMRWLISDLYRLEEFDYSNFTLYDLFHLADDCHERFRVSFRYNRKNYELEGVYDQQSEEVNIRFMDKWYRNFADFLMKGEIDGQKITHLNRNLYGFEVMENDE